ncbi:MAG: sulfatase, partial [Planctomycetes bacterium]|nr:sulfatase [Planctomycetota bacterium]
MSKRNNRRKERERADRGGLRSEGRKSATLAAIGGGGLAVAGALVWISFGGSGDWPAAMQHGSAAGYNVLLVTLDTTRADRLGCYGYDAAGTPTLDALAKQGIRFDDAVTVAPVTLPSHASILTGLAPHHHGVRNNGGFHLEPTHVTLAEVLSDRGYQTAAFIAAFVLDARYGLDQGFDVYNDDVALDSSNTIEAFARPIYERSATRVTSDAVSWLGARDRTRPFFCWVHYFDPHKPYHAPPPFDARFRNRPYDGEIAYMDAQIGRLVQALKREGAWDNTLIVVVADHGEGLGDHGEATHAKLIYDSVMRVPLIMACPGLFEQSYIVDDVVVSVTDIFPTVLDLLGMEIPVDVDGLSLLAARSKKDRTIYMENLATYLDNGWSPLYRLRRH